MRHQRPIRELGRRKQPKATASSQGSTDSAEGDLSEAVLSEQSPPQPSESEPTTGMPTSGFSPESLQLLKPLLREVILECLQEFRESTEFRELLHQVVAEGVAQGEGPKAPATEGPAVSPPSVLSQTSGSPTATSGPSVRSGSSSVPPRVEHTARKASTGTRAAEAAVAERASGPASRGAAAAPSPASRRAADAPVAELAERLQIGSEAPVSEESGWSGEDGDRSEKLRILERNAPPDERLPEILNHCRSKARAAVLAEEITLEAARDGLVPADPRFHRELTRIAQDSITFQEVLISSDPPCPPRDWRQLRECLTAVADGLQLILPLIGQPQEHYDFLKNALTEIARAQSALRVIYEDVTQATFDDQKQVYNWLRLYAYRNEFLLRFMKIRSPEDPSRSADMLRQIRYLREVFENTFTRERTRRRLFQKLQYQVGRLDETADADRDYAWDCIDETVDELLTGGLPSSDLQLRKRLLPYYDELPERDDWSVGMQQAVRAMERYLQEQEEREQESTEGASTDTLSESVQQVADLIRGKEIVIVGGEERTDARDQLQQAFGLNAVHWPGIGSTGKAADFEAWIGRKDVCLVVMLIRFRRHGFEAVKRYCRQKGCPMVRLPGGFHPNSLAAAVLEQCSDQLNNGAV